MSKKKKENKTKDNPTRIPTVSELESEIVTEAKRIALKETSSCFILMEKALELMNLESRA